MTLKDIINQGSVYSRNTSANTYYTTSYQTSANTAVSTSRFTSQITSHNTSVPEARSVYTLGGVDSVPPGSGWYVGDIAYVYFNSSNTQPAPGYGYRAIRIDSVTAPGGAFMTTSLSAAGGYYSVNGGAIDMSSGYLRASSGGYTTFSGGSPSGVLGTINVNTSALTSYSTSFATAVNSTRATSATTSHQTEGLTTYLTQSPYFAPTVANVLIIGQSNVANYGVSSDSYKPTANVIRVSSAGAWVRADSPASSMASGTGANLDGRIGDSLISQTSFNQCRIVNIAVGGTKLGWWRSDAATNVYAKRTDDPFTYANSRLFERISYAAQLASAGNFKFTHVLVCIGESDGLASTTTAQFKDDFAKVQSDLIALGITAPIFLSRTSYGGSTAYPAIIQAQNEIINEGPNVYAGPNTDSYVGAGNRWDGLHFTSAALNVVGGLWGAAMAVPQGVA